MRRARSDRERRQDRMAGLLKRAATAISLALLAAGVASGCARAAPQTAKLDAPPTPPPPAARLDTLIEDLRSIAVPTLVLCGDRDFLCPPENAVQAYRALGANGELAIVPGLGHELSRAAIALTIEFLQRHRS